MPILLIVFRSLLMICLVSVAKPDIVGSLKICALRISFQEDELLSTTGNGQFLMENKGIDCGDYTLDTAPHNKLYFESQIEAVDNYFRDVSYGKFGLDIDQSTVYPSGTSESYSLPNKMNYYNPYVENDLQEKRLTELFRDALEIADSLDNIDFSSYDLVLVFHAGIGQDFSLPFLDPTPEDLPSTFIDQKMIEEHLGVSSLNFNGSEISKGILLPETQNHLLFEVSESMFSDASEPCEYQYALTGTFALMIGFSIGLPPMWNIETGNSGIGIFGLMDQGSNNGRGVIPSPPNAWSRIYSGWETATNSIFFENIFLPSRSENNIIKVPINDSEYFLIENRSNRVRNGMSLDSIRVLMVENNTYPPYIEVLQDSIGLTKSSNGVITSVPNYDIGLPASGLLIWHIDENIITEKINNYSINNDLENLGVNLEEADGAQDLGYSSIFPFNDPSSGYFGDLWFKGNSQYELANPTMKGMLPEFGHSTFPSTESNSGSKSFIVIENISSAMDTMNFNIINSFIINYFPDTAAHVRSIFDTNNDGLNEIIGGIDTLYIAKISDSEGIQKNNFHPVNYQDLDILFTSDTDNTKIHILERNNDSSIYSVYEHYFSGNTTSLISQNNIDSLVYPLISKNDVTLEFKSQNQWQNYSKRVFGSPNNFGIDISESGIQIDSFTQAIRKWEEVKFVYVAGIDLDQDSKLDVLALDEIGKLYAFNHDLISLSGFPTKTLFTAPILSRDLFGNPFPEIIGKSKDSTSIIILNNKGNIIYHISTKKDDPLICLAEINNNNSIVTKSIIYSFDPFSNSNGNEWSFEHGLQKNRTIELLYSDSNEVSDNLLIRSYMYPNPIKKGNGTFRVESFNADFIEVIIYDLLGVQVQSFTKNLSQCCNQINEWIWETNDLEVGVYFAFVNIKNDRNNQSEIVKIAVLK